MDYTPLIKLEGCSSFRQRICFSLLSGRPIFITNIRAFDQDPEHETKLMELLCEISNGTKVFISKTGTQVRFEPGMLSGGQVEFDCGNSRCLSYFLEALIFMAPFCGKPVEAILKGVTNWKGELSVDAIRACWLPVFNKFILDDENLSIKINARGFAPDGGGRITFTSPCVKKLRPVKRLNPGKVCKIRGLAYVCKVSPTLANRMIDAAKAALRGYLADVYITVDQRKGPQAGNSPGFGIFLTAETTEGVFYHGEAVSNPVGSSDEAVNAEDVGEEAASKLLNEIMKAGCLDTTAQAMASIFMTLCDRDINKFLYGEPSLYTVETLRNLNQFFHHKFKIDELKDVTDDDLKRVMSAGSPNRAVFTCQGIGFLNLNKGIL